MAHALLGDKIEEQCAQEDSKKDTLVCCRCCDETTVLVDVTWSGTQRSIVLSTQVLSQQMGQCVAPRPGESVITSFSWVCRYGVWG